MRSVFPSLSIFEGRSRRFLSGEAGLGSAVVQQDVGWMEVRKVAQCSDGGEGEDAGRVLGERGWSGGQVAQGALSRHCRLRR